MGFYLNSKKPGLLFGENASAAYFVDKTAILKELIPLVESEPAGVCRKNGNKYICITRPRRFGKTVMANMISSFFGKGTNSRALFDTLAAACDPAYQKHLHKHNVIHIMLNEMPDECTSYKEYIARIKRLLLEDLIRAFPDARIQETDALWDALNKIIEFGDGEKFIFVLDEWDFIFHRSFITKDDRASYIGFLSSLLKDQPYVELAYMTGILPIAKYSSGSELNMFFEYTMAGKEKYSSYFGFTDEEVDLLYERYQSMEPSPKVTREGLRLWYDGYETISGRRLYNPRSVTGALSDNQLSSYWTSSGPYDEIFYYLEHNVAKMRDDIALMVSGTPVSANIQEYAATSMNLTTRDEILSAMVVFGFLSCKDGMVSIPNLELMNRFADMLQKEPSFGYVHQLAKASARMLKATKEGDTHMMSKILEYAHHTESPLLCYNSEAELAAVIRLVYLEARNTYRIEREEKAGIGYADFIFYPKKTDDDCIILELKVNSTAKAAIQQIKRQNYALNFFGSLGSKPVYTGRILAVGIAYQKKDKKHHCLVEVLRQHI